MFAADPSRETTAREAVGDLAIGRVLDIGCGAGQELRPFVRDPATLGVGADLSPEIGIAGRDLFASEQPGSRVAFVRAAAEHLPFTSSSMDLVICRLALPYTDNSQALAEISRVLRPGGALLLKFHHARFYLLELRDAARTRHFKSAVHACRVLVAGLVYHVTGVQPRGRLTGGEAFQTMWLLRRELARNELEIRRVLAGSVPAAPSVLVQRRAASADFHGLRRHDPEP